MYCINEIKCYYIDKSGHKLNFYEPMWKFLNPSFALQNALPVLNLFDLQFSKFKFKTIQIRLACGQFSLNSNL